MTPRCCIKPYLGVSFRTRLFLSDKRIDLTKLLLKRGAFLNIKALGPAAFVGHGHGASRKSGTLYRGVSGMLRCNKRDCTGVLSAGDNV